MPNKKINALDARTAVSTDLMLVGDPATGTAYKSTVANLPLVPTSRTITINGVAFDLSANRAWTLGTVTSVGLTMPSAFGVANSPITSSGTLAVTALGTASQYIRGDGVLATLPTGGSGGSSVSYYLNGGTAASVGTYFQMSTNAVVGANADFTRTGNGLISQFLTDVGDPNRLQIPAGNWNFEMFFSMSSNGGTPEFYVELLKYDGTTFTSIASSSAIPEVISGGTIIDLYLTSLAIPATSLLATDRLALRVYIVNNSGGRTATLHTQDSHLCQIITNFAGGLSALNGLTANTQYFATGTSGSSFNIVSSGDTHTFNMPPSENIYTANGTLTSARTLTHGGFSLSLVGSTHTNRFTSAGRLLLGTTSESTFILDAVGTARITGDITLTSNGQNILISNFAPVINSRNIFIGGGGLLSVAGANSFNGTSNTSIGFEALLANTTGYNNVAIGVNALKANTTGGQNFALGLNSLLSNTTGLQNIAIGENSLRSNIGGTGNFAFGYESMYSNISGADNTCVGAYSLRNNTTGSNNIAIGYESLLNNNAIQNTSVGVGSLRGNTSGGQNSSFGQSSLRLNTTGSYNASFAIGALSQNTTGQFNSAFGSFALGENTTGSNNVNIGYYAGRYITGGVTANAISNNSIFLGYDTRALASNQTNQIVIGYNETGLGSNTTIIGNSSTITTAIRGRLILGGTTDSGLYQLDVNGTARVSGAMTISGGSFVANSLYYSSVYGMVVAGGVGSSSDLLLTDRTGGLRFQIVNGGNIIQTSSVIAGVNIGTLATSINISNSVTYGLQIWGNTTSSNYAIQMYGDGGTNGLHLGNNGNVVIGAFNATNNASAILQAQSTTKGFLPPRMTTTQINAIATPAAGLMVYDTTLNKLCVYTTAWEVITSL